MEEIIIELSQEFTLAIKSSSRRNFGTQPVEERGLYFTATVIAESDTTKLSGTAWGDSVYAALTGALEKVRDQVYALRRAL